MFRRGPAVLLAVVMFAAAAPAGAETKIGEARRIENSVTGKTAAVEKRLARGDEVFLDQRIISGVNSLGQFTFMDGTNFAVGSGANVVLDKFVYQPGGTVSAFAVSVSKGAFRFATGNGPSAAYSINTPTSTIGVRGTMFDIYVAGGATLVVQLNGSSKVCSRTNKKSCVELTSPCQAARVEPDGRVSKAARLNAAFLAGAPAAQTVPFVLNQGRLVGRLRAAPNTVARCADGVSGSSIDSDTPGGAGGDKDAPDRGSSGRGGSESGGQSSGPF